MHAVNFECGICGIESENLGNHLHKCELFELTCNLNYHNLNNITPLRPQKNLTLTPQKNMWYCCNLLRKFCK